MLCLGCNVPSDGSCPTRIFGENLSVILNSQNPAADSSKKYVAISFHIVREAVADGINKPYWLKGTFRTSDIMTKQITRPDFKEHVDYINWRPDFHIQDHIRLDDSHKDSHKYCLISLILLLLYMY